MEAILTCPVPSKVFSELKSELLQQMIGGKILSVEKIIDGRTGCLQFKIDCPNITKEFDHTK